MGKQKQAEEEQLKGEQQNEREDYEGLFKESDSTARKAFKVVVFILLLPFILLYMLAKLLAPLCVKCCKCLNNCLIKCCTCFEKCFESKDKGRVIEEPKTSKVQEDEGQSCDCCRDCLEDCCDSAKKCPWKTFLCCSQCLGSCFQTVFDKVASCCNSCQKCCCKDKCWRRTKECIVRGFCNTCECVTDECAKCCIWCWGQVRKFPCGCCEWTLSLVSQLFQAVGQMASSVCK